MEIPRVAVVATYNRPAELRRLLDAITPQCHAVVVVDNASDPPVDLLKFWPVEALDRSFCRVHVLRDEEQPPNLSRLWNVGLDYARKMIVDPRAGESWDVAVLNDDAVPPPGWWTAVSNSMRFHGAAAGSSDPFDQLSIGQYRMWFDDAPMSVTTRLAGWAMMLRGEWDGARFDETFRWWAGDDDLSLRARQAGGIVHVGGYPVPNTGADSSTVGVLAEEAGRDMARFVEKHGRRPW